MNLRHEAKRDAGAARQITMEHYRTLAPELLRAARAMSPDAMLAQDAMQETYLRFFLAQMHGEVVVEPRAWLHRVQRNLLIDAKRAERAHPQVNFEEHSRKYMDRSADGSGTRGLFSFEWRKTAELVLAPREWQCIRLRADGLDYREIASVLDIRMGTVAALLNRATSKLRNVFLRRERLA